jgi:ElaB/YqjD/DUF883 family membrane-anchored ribosome-binding protein
MESHFPHDDQSQSQIARDRVLADLQALAQDAEMLLRATTDDIGDKAKEARGRVADALARAKATCADLQQHGVDSAKAAARKADDTIRTHPYESLAVAFGIGILLGALFRRK